ncbi:hypothetical protein L9F63_020676, partial [Diploptera punctata]
PKIFFKIIITIECLHLYYFHSKFTFLFDLSLPYDNNPFTFGKCLLLSNSLHIFFLNLSLHHLFNVTKVVHVPQIDSNNPVKCIFKELDDLAFSKIFDIFIRNSVSKILLPYIIIFYFLD